MTICYFNYEKTLKMYFNDQNFNQKGRGISKFKTKGHYDALDEGGRFTKSSKYVT